MVDIGVSDYINPDQRALVNALIEECEGGKYAAIDEIAKDLSGAASLYTLALLTMGYCETSEEKAQQIHDSVHAFARMLNLIQKTISIQRVIAHGEEIAGENQAVLELWVQHLPELLGECPTQEQEDKALDALCYDLGLGSPEERLQMRRQIIQAQMEGLQGAAKAAFKQAFFPVAKGWTDASSFWEMYAAAANAAAQACQKAS